uniref:Putative helicase n=1 Tax=viral metagenome TaxID=1070528 RepID=A0A6M3KU30_9ZZZZ
MSMEGLLGPVIGELTIQEGIERNVLAKPKVIIKKLPDNPSLAEKRSYQDTYHYGVVNNRALNRQVVLDAIEDSKDGPVLILVTEIEHGQNIMDMARNIYNRDFTFVRGGTEKDQREIIRQMMISGKTDVVVATAVFKKGLDVPNISSVILAFGGKSNAQTIQAIGRGTRNVEGDKEFVIIRDYFISNNVHLIKHFGHRLCLYMEEGWL